MKLNQLKVGRTECWGTCFNWLELLQSIWIWKAAASKDRLRIWEWWGLAEQQLKLDPDRPCQMCWEPTATEIFVMFFEQALPPSQSEVYFRWWWWWTVTGQIFFQTPRKNNLGEMGLLKSVFSSFSYHPVLNPWLDFKTHLFQLPAARVWQIFKNKEGKGAFPVMQLRLDLDLGWGSPWEALPWPQNSISCGIFSIGAAPEFQRQQGWFQQLFVQFLCLQVARKFFLTFNN